MASKLRGVVFYQGPSMIDGSPIVGVATFGTANGKTGNLVQTWIIRTDVEPTQALNTGADSAICGNCPLRGTVVQTADGLRNKGRSCYVLVQQAPLAVYRSFQKGNYPKLAKSHAKKFVGRGLRYGSYGDPVAIPMKAWDKLSALCTGKAQPGYTHQWADVRFSDWSTRIMASTHSVEECERAKAMGWRTFRTVTNLADKSKTEIVCPASEEAGFTKTCETCGACNGRRDASDVRYSVVIAAHGSGGKTEGVGRVIEASKRYALAMAA